MSAIVYSCFIGMLLNEVTPAKVPEAASFVAHSVSSSILDITQMFSRDKPSFPPFISG
jgi:hypothetical protein